jgi:hypothetical protein
MADAGVVGLALALTEDKEDETMALDGVLAAAETLLLEVPAEVVACLEVIVDVVFAEDWDDLGADCEGLAADCEEDEVIVGLGDFEGGIVDILEAGETAVVLEDDFEDSRSSPGLISEDRDLAGVGVIADDEALEAVLVLEDEAEAAGVTDDDDDDDDGPDLRSKLLVGLFSELGRSLELRLSVEAAGFRSEGAA